MAPAAQPLRLYERGPGSGARPRDASVGRLSGVETRETGESCSGPDSDEGMKCSGGGQHELTGRRLHFVLFLALGFKDTDMQH